MQRIHSFIGLSACLSLLASPTWAVKPASWTHEQPKDFTSGKLDNLVVTSLGELMLAREHKKLFDPAEKAEVINALAEAGDGAIYAATGPRGIIYRIVGEQVTEFATLPPEGGTVFSLLFAQDGRLLAGTGGGEKARIYRIDGTGKSSVFYEPKGARYVWAMARGDKGQVYAATGIEGQLHVIDADGKNGKVLADLKPKNLLCLAIGADGMLYTGTDEEGLIYRIAPDSGKAFVMYDAKEAEISAIVLDNEGNVYASTASAEAARPGREIADKPGGRPDVASKPAGNGKKAEKATDKHDSEKPAASSPGTQKADDSESLDADGDEDTKDAVAKIFSAARSASRSASRPAPEGGNAIYKIDRSGFVSEVYRAPVMILAMVESNGTIYVATGNEGRVYAVTPGEDKSVMLVKLEPEQVTTLIRRENGELIAGTANAALLVRIMDHHAAKGTLTSTVLDAGQIVKWGTITTDIRTPEGTSLTVATRSSNVENEESDVWEPWSPELQASAAQQISSISARFLQYRLTLETTRPTATPSLRRVQISRIEENRAPKIASVTLVSAREEAQNPSGSPKVKAMFGGGFGGGGDGESPQQSLGDSFWVAKWQASDPNKDLLSYDVFMREVGQSRWIRIEEDTKEAFRLWDTRTVPDGHYEIRVVAKDTRSNPPGTDLTDARVSDPILVDNTPPDVTIDKAEPGKDEVAVRVTFKDAMSPIVEAAYLLNSNEEWIPLAADDDVFDSLSESATFTIRKLKPGEHRLAIRAKDRQNNTRYITRTIQIGG